MTALTPRPTQTLEQALRQHNLTWQQLERLAHAALNEALRRRRITLDDDRRERAHEYHLDKGIRRLLAYDPARAGGTSITTSIYRHMLGETVAGSTLIDFLRQTHGDERRGTPIHEQPASDHLPDIGAFDDPSLDQAANDIADGLSTDEAWTLRNLGAALANGIPLVAAAHELDLDLPAAHARLDQLQAALADRITE